MKSSYPTIFTLAFRYAYGTTHHKALRLMTRICFISIALGSCALMLTLIITHGFEKTIHEKMQGIHADVLLSAPGQKIAYDTVRSLITEEYGEHFSGISGISVKQLILKNGDNHSVILLKGIDPERETSVSCLEKKILQKRATQARKLGELLTFQDKKKKRVPLLMGKKCAEQLGVTTGDLIEVYVPEPTAAQRISLTKRKCYITATFSVGLDEYDAHCAITSLRGIAELFEEEEKEIAVDYLSLKRSERSIQSKSWLEKIISFFSYNLTDKEQELLSLRKRFPQLQVQSWQELYPELVSSLRLEKYVMFFIIALITLVACMNMLSLLYMLIEEKRGDFALFKSMGAPSSKIYQLCLMIGLTLSLSATVTGLGCAAIIGYFLEYHAMIPLPDVYYVSHLPARMELFHFILVFLCSVFMGLIATLIPAHRARSQRIVDVLKQR